MLDRLTIRLSTGQPQELEQFRPSYLGKLPQNLVFEAQTICDVYLLKEESVYYNCII